MRTRKGFTLVELLIVVAIIGVLSSMMSLISGDSSARARGAQITGNYKTIGNAVALYILDAYNSGDTPSETNFKNISGEYINAQLGDYTVTSESNKWFVEYTGKYKSDSALLKALKSISADMSWKGLKARIY